MIQIHGIYGSGFRKINLILPNSKDETLIGTIIKINCFFQMEKYLNVYIC